MKRRISGIICLLCAVLIGVSAAWLWSPAQGKGGSSPQLVERLGFSPPLVSIPEGTRIEFVVQPLPAIPLSQLEFRLWDFPRGAPDWRVRQDWRPWPLDPLEPGDGRIAWQIDVRRRSDPTAVDQRWLGEVYVAPGQEQRGKNCLIRNLLADDFDRLEQSDAQAALAREVWLAVHLLLWESQRLAPDEVLRAVRTLPGVEAAALETGGLSASSDAPEQSGDRSSRPPETIVVHYQDGSRYRFDTGRKTLREAGSPVVLDLSLAAYPQYAEVFKIADGLAPAAKAALAATYAVYAGYRYGTPPFNPTVRSGLAHCGASAALLMQILQANRIEAETVVVALPNGSVHALVHASPDGAPLALDPTIGHVYPGDIGQMGGVRTPAPLALPRVRDLPWLDLRTLLADRYDLVRYSRLAPGVTPPAPIQEIDRQEF